jgi:hypothetical protein
LAGPRLRERPRPKDQNVFEVPFARRTPSMT